MSAWGDSTPTSKFEASQIEFFQLEEAEFNLLFEVTGVFVSKALNTNLQVPEN